MTMELYVAAAVVAAVLLGVLVALLVMRPRVGQAFEAGKASLTPELERVTDELARQSAAINSLNETVSEKAALLKQSEERANALDIRVAVADQKNQEIPDLKAAAAERDKQLQQLNAELKRVSAELATETERTSQLKTVTAKLEQREQAINALKDDLSRQKAEISELQTRIEEERKQATEKLALLNEARTELTNQFRVLAQEILDEKGKTFGEQSKAGLKTLLDPFRDQLSEFRKKVDDVYVSETRERATLKKEIEILRDLNQQISQEAVNLTRALKGDKKAQGTWGELILERVLEKSGLRKGVEYDTQGSFRDGDGSLLRPDVIVHLPDDKCVIVDSKVSLIAYEHYASAETETEQKMALAEHLKAVRAHVESLNAKGYSELKGIKSLDYILMFMPIEAAFVAAFREDEALYTYAFERHIIIVTPSTLLATLKTIESIWRFEKQNRSAQEIVAKARMLYNKLRLFLESMETLGNQIDTAHRTYDKAMNRLTQGKGNVISQAAAFSDLGVPIKLQIPQSIMDSAEIEGGATLEDAEDADADLE